MSWVGVNEAPVFEQPGWYWMLGNGAPEVVEVLKFDDHWRVRDSENESFAVGDPWIANVVFYGPLVPPVFWQGEDR